VTLVTAEFPNITSGCYGAILGRSIYLFFYVDM